MLISKLAFGPMSAEIIEAVFRYSAEYQIQLMLICSRNQVDYNYGYVFNTREYMAFIAQMKKQYPLADVKICRDHCGPGFSSSGDDLESVKRTIAEDLSTGFDLIHLDLCHLAVDHNTKIAMTIDLIEFAQGIKPNVLFEIGTDENVGVAEADCGRIANDLNQLRSICHPEFYVVQTGSLVKEARNIGTFEKELVRRLADVLHSKNIKLKEHNADYLESNRIAKRRGIVDAINIAPQLGVVQTQCVLMLADIYGINYDSFTSTIIHGRKWAKWMDLHTNQNRLLITMLAGHYHYQSVPYIAMTQSIERHTSVKENVIEVISKVVHHYATEFGALT